ncbi:glutathione S-transferase 1-1-like [Oratosquilla oratoria]|uniref:glutathione S-transferase 1-1-like n=1 Tax=Oratosquilla oratoria TaxID=337810 RepID=UPI003F7767D0
MSHIDFYYTERCPSCRSVMLVAKALGLDFNKKRLNLKDGEHLKPEFMAINPQHCVPTLVDGPLTIWESRPICTYLISKYGKGDELYPKDLVQRAYIDRLLYFDMGTVYRSFADYAFPVYFGRADKLEKEKLDKLQEALGHLDTQLKGRSFAAGNKITVADFVLVATVETIYAFGIDISKHTNVESWLNRCRNQMEGYEECSASGAAALGAEFKAKVKEIEN